jgi:hypothetical protein
VEQVISAEMPRHYINALEDTIASRVRILQHDVTVPIATGVITVVSRARHPLAHAARGMENLLPIKERKISSSSSSSNNKQQNS